MTQQIIIQNNIHGSSIMLLKSGSTYSPNNQTQTTKHKLRRTHLPLAGQVHQCLKRTKSLSFSQS